MLEIFIKRSNRFSKGKEDLSLKRAGRGRNKNRRGSLEIAKIELREDLLAEVAFRKIPGFGSMNDKYYVCMCVCVCVCRYLLLAVSRTTFVPATLESENSSASYRGRSKFIRTKENSVVVAAYNDPTVIFYRFYDIRHIGDTGNVLIEDVAGRRRDRLYFSIRSKSLN